jgi:hypothetical protein
MNFKSGFPLSSRIAGLCASFVPIANSYALVLSALVLVCISLGWTSRGQQQRQATQKAKAQRQMPHAIHAIHTLITPSQGSSWPMRYRELAARADASRSDKINLPLDHIVLDFILDTIEIRGYEVCFS